MNRKINSWLKLALGLALALGLSALAHVIVAVAPLPVLQRNLNEDLDATPLFYSEVGDLAEFLQPGGKYWIEPNNELGP